MARQLSGSSQRALRREAQCLVAGEMVRGQTVRRRVTKAFVSGEMLSHAKVCEPSIRDPLGTAAHLCTVVVLCMRRSSDGQTGFG